MNLNRNRPSCAVGLWLLAANAGPDAEPGAAPAVDPTVAAQKPEQKGDGSDAPPPSSKKPAAQGAKPPAADDDEDDEEDDEDDAPPSSKDGKPAAKAGAVADLRSLEARDVQGMPGAVCFDSLGEFDAAVEPPTEFKILSRGLTRMRKGGRMFNVLFDDGSEQKCTAAMKLKAQDTLPLDYDHGMLGMIATRESSAAAGWFRMEVRSDGLYAAGIEWTKNARKSIKQREYRFTSPAIMLEQTDEEGTARCVELVNVALTNLPATVGQKALVASAKEQKNDMLITKELLAKLGLKDDAGEAEVVARLTELATKASSTDAANASAEQARVAAEASKAEVAKLSEKAGIADQLSQRVQTLEAERAAQQHASIFSAGKAAGKISPSLEAWAKAQSAEQLSAFLKDAPVLLGGRTMPAGDPAAVGKDGAAIDEVEHQVCKLLNLQPKKFAKQKAKLADLPASNPDLAVALTSKPTSDPYFTPFRGVGG